MKQFFRSSQADLLILSLSLQQVKFIPYMLFHEKKDRNDFLL